MTEPLDHFDFLWKSYGHTPKDKLLEFAKDWPDIAALRQLNQKRLAQVYCAGIAENLWAMHARAQNQPPPGMP